MKRRFSKPFLKILFPILLIIYILMLIIIQLNGSNLFYKTKARIFCLILTQPRDLFTKGEAVNNTWANDCDKYFFIVRLYSIKIDKTVELSHPFPILQPAYYTNENYTSLTDKLFPIYKHIYSTYNDFDWYLKADDDTFIFMENLRSFLKDKDSKIPVSYGHNWNFTKVKNGYESGGAGYVLSNEAMNRLGRKLAENYSFCLNTGTEDIDTSRCLRDLNVNSGWTRDEEKRQRFHAYDFRKELILRGLSSFIDSSISYHYIDSISMYKLYKLWKNYLKKREIEGENSVDFLSIVYTMIFTRIKYKLDIQINKYKTKCKTSGYVNK